MELKIQIYDEFRGDVNAVGVLTPMSGPHVRSS